MTTYSPLSEPERDSEYSNDTATPFAHNEKALLRTKPHSWLWVLQGALLLCSTTILILAYQRPVQDAECVKQLFGYSPLSEVVEYHEENYKGIFHQPSIYRGKPTPELDENWRQLWDYGAFNVPLDKLPLFNRSADMNLQRTPEEFGGGAAAMLWGYHQIHCLDMIRQSTWLDVYRDEYNMTPKSLDGPDYLRRMHMDHCIELMRIDMMCNIDVTPYFVWEDPTAPNGIRADFNSHHKCRNFEKIHDWMVNHIAIP